MEYISKKTMVDPETHRCIYTEKWKLDGPTNPLHDWLINVMNSGGTCDQPNELPKLVCSEINYKQTEKGGRGDAWLLFSTAKTPFKKDAVNRLTNSHVAVEIVYGVDQVSMKFDIGSDWKKALRLVDELEKFRTGWVSPSISENNLIFPKVDRGTDDSEDELQDESA